MKNNKDILFLLEEVQTMAQTLCSEKAGLEDQVKKVEDELSPLRSASMFPLFVEEFDNNFIST